jgi:putative transposase
MPRAPRVFVDGAMYHVYCRVGRGEPVFADETEARELLELLREIKARDDLTIFAWCVMSNHYHLALRSSTVPLWRSMRLLQGRFAKAYNRRRALYGPVWQGRYRSRLVTGERDLDQVIAYIHLNPVSAGVVRDPAAYAMSGHRELLGRVEDPLIDVDEALAGFGEPLAAARAGYAKALAEVSGSPWAGREPGGLPWWSAGRGRAGRAPAPRPVVDALGASTAPERPRLAPADFVDLAAGATGTTRSELGASRRGAAITRTRELVALVGAELFGLRVRDLAAALGRDAGTVSRWITAAGARRARDVAYRRTVEDVTVRIADAARSLQATRSGMIFESGTATYSG